MGEASTIGQTRTRVTVLTRVAAQAALVLLALLVFWGGADGERPLAAQTPAAQVWPGDQPGRNIAVELLLEHAPRAGEPVTAALRFVPRSREWHGYWANPGDAGLGMQAEWQLPRGWAAGEPLYPVPYTLRIGDLMNHVYKGEHVVIVPLMPGADAAGGQVRVRLDYLACTDQICVPETAVVTGRWPQNGRDERFERWRAALAPDLAAPGRFTLAGDRVRVLIPLPAAQSLSDPHLFVRTEGVVAAAGAQRFTRAGDQLVAELPLLPGAAAAPPEAIEGILAFAQGAPDGVRFTAAPGPVPDGLPPIAAQRPMGALVLLMGGALLGGLLLNVMPCVFPILSLKALSLARAGADEGAPRRDGLAYTAGAVLACLGLGAAVLLLRAGGEQVGWAFQLQEPAVVLALFLLALALTANFLGLFELPGLPLRAGGKPAGAFATGLLAAFVATPCTGPFMATALGAALLLPAPWALALFAALGLGLALPFLLLALVPGLRRRLPRPGPWLERFRRLMAVPMGLTAMALAWLLWRLGGHGYLALVLAGGAVLLALLGLAGREQRRASGRPGLAGVAALAGAVLAVALLPAPSPGQSAAAASALPGTQPFSEAALAQARAQGRPVFVWFTADWCITCKVNEAAAIEREDTGTAFAKAGVVALRGDWTRRDPAITRFLSDQGAAGVPLYLWYAPGARAPEQLPQVLTPAMLSARAAASGPSPTAR
ncbi:thiol:disulfide interchange protein [Erythrobacteraceae bacterium CFH 75059]|uniref:protein-disulfide reductase DsbD family protein n=1 Tax=Qipengyuania thermophila TaxID=2509361 RepID=UPI001021E09F|nr:thioredoxin family protein [Qipengyuania thermophila]TCD06371.1 thiol:disulfide interchange protein [Erythrobacteraceae bacterium CFH 75059]